MFFNVEFKIKSRKSSDYNFFDYLEVICYPNSEGRFSYHVVAEQYCENPKREILEIFHSPEAAFDFVNKAVGKYPIIAKTAFDVVEYQGV